MTKFLPPPGSLAYNTRPDSCPELQMKFLKFSSFRVLHSVSISLPTDRRRNVRDILACSFAHRRPRLSPELIAADLITWTSCTVVHLTQVRSVSCSSHYLLKRTSLGSFLRTVILHSKKKNKKNNAVRRIVHFIYFLVIKLWKNERTYTSNITCNSRYALRMLQS